MTVTAGNEAVRSLFAVVTAAMGDDQQTCMEVIESTDSDLLAAAAASTIAQILVSLHGPSAPAAWQAAALRFEEVQAGG